jgi:hypothetical protein
MKSPYFAEFCDIVQSDYSVISDDFLSCLFAALLLRVQGNKAVMMVMILNHLQGQRKEVHELHLHF